jgi:hypothetical protein
VVAEAERLGWIAELIQALRQFDAPHARAQLDALGSVDEIEQSSFFDACYVDHFPMVDRKQLRKKLRTVAAADGKRILVVKGERYAGNSHALRHIRHVSGRLGIPLAEFSLARYVTGEELQPYDLGVEIAQALGRTLPERLDRKASRWTVNFINWLATNVDPKRDRLWIAFDDFEKEKLKVALPEPIYEFVQALGDAVANRIRGVRLFLINYDRSLPNELNFQIDLEKVPQIAEEDIADFFLDFYRDHVGEPDIEKAAKDAADRARSVCSGLSADSPQRLHQMRDALRAQCDELRGGNDED